MPNHKNKL